jgi:hypothetical protein
MVSALTSTRLISAQLALKTLLVDDTSDDSSSNSSSSSSSLLSNATNSVSSLPSQSQASLASLLNGLSSSDTTSSSSSTPASTDITTASFMTLLKQNLTATAAGTSNTAKQAQAMLDALNAGTLTVTDPTNGVSITAWDPSKADSSDSSKTTTGNTPTSIPTTDWNDYLKAHLSRNSDSTLTRTADNSFVDKTTGNEAYFGQVGTEFYYMSWTAASTTASGTTGTPAATATSA